MKNSDIEAKDMLKAYEEINEQMKRHDPGYSGPEIVQAAADGWEATAWCPISIEGHEGTIFAYGSRAGCYRLAASFRGVYSFVSVGRETKPTTSKKCRFYVSFQNEELYNMFFPKET